MHKGKKLGDGTFGVVYQAVSPGKTQYAVKRNLASDETDFFGAVREAHVLNDLRDHPFVVCLHGVMRRPFRDQEAMSPLLGEQFRDQKSDERHFVFDKADSSMEQRVFSRIDFGDAQRYMLQMLLALEYIHAKGYVHRDIKPANALFFAEQEDDFGTAGVVQICDFGLAKPYIRQDAQTPGVVTSWYRAPEVALGKGNDCDYGAGVDVWALGCVFYELMFKQHIFTLTEAEEKNENRNLLYKLAYALPGDLAARLKQIRSRYGAPPRRRYIHNKTPFSARAKIRNPQLFAERTGASLEDFGSLLDHMLEWEQNARWTATQCIDSPFFASMSDYAAHYRATYAAVRAPTPLFRTSGIEARWVADYAKRLFVTDASLEWYTSHRILFQAVDLFWRYVQTLEPSGEFETEDRGLYLSRGAALRAFTACLYLSIKFFQSLGPATSLEDLGIDPGDKQAMAEIGEIENKMLLCAGPKLQVYRPTLYEQTEFAGDTVTNSHVFPLLLVSLLNPHLDGMTVETAYAWWRDRVRTRYDALLQRVTSEKNAEARARTQIEIEALCSSPPSA